MEVDRLHGDVAEHEVEQAIALAGSYGDVLADQRLGCLQASSAKADAGSIVDATDNVVRAVLERLDLRAEATRARAVAIGRHRQAQCIVGAVMVVAVPPDIEAVLGLGEIGEGPAV